MKITGTIAIIMMGIVINGFGVCAAEVDAINSNEALTAAATAVVAFEEGYDESVVARMVGRAGATSPTGAKGIAFETVYADKLNAQEFIKGSGNITKQTSSSTAQQVDLVTMDETGKVLSRIQCKDTPNSIAKTIEQAKSGKYTQAQLVGTTETAEAFNAEATAAGVTKTMKDSGISTKTTERIAEKALATTPENVVKNTAKGATYCGILDGGIAVYESVRDGDSLSEAIGHVSTQTTIGTVAGGAALGTATAAATGLTALGAGTVATVAVPAAAAVGVGYGVHKGAEYVVEKYDVEDTVAETWQMIGDETVQLAGSAVQYIDNTEVGSKAIDYTVKAADTTNKGLGYVVNGWETTYNYIVK